MNPVFQTLADQVSLASDEYDKVSFSLDSLAHSHAVLQEENANLVEQVNTLAAEVERLKDLLDNIGNPPPPPPPPTKRQMLLGAAVQKKSGETLAEATKRWETEVGVKNEIARRFQGNFPSTWASASNFTPDQGVRHRVISVKGEPSQAQLETFLRTIPQDGFTTYVAWNHEPENDGGTHTPAWYKAGNARLLAAVRAVKRTDIVATFILMTWLDKDGNDSTTSADWFPAEPEAWVMGIDPYDPNNKQTLEESAKNTLAVWKSKGGSKWMITETGTHRSGADGAKWVADGLKWAQDNGAIAVQWFDSDVGDAAGPEGWHLSDDQMKAAWRNFFNS
jgi:hypothetical protein